VETSQGPQRAPTCGRLPTPSTDASPSRARPRPRQRVERSFAETLGALESAEAELGGRDPAHPKAMDAEQFHELLSVRLGAAVYRARVRGCRDALRLVAERIGNGARDA